MHFVLIINVARYKVFPLAGAMTRSDDQRAGEVSCCFGFKHTLLKHDTVEVGLIYFPRF
jgi:hypothetical protein